MSFSRELKEKMNQFAKEQSQHYLEEAEMTYMEKLRRKTGQAKSKIMAKLEKFKSRSETSLEAQNDMIIYMSDYMNDLIAEGLSEREAFERAKEDLTFRSETAKSSDLQEQFAKYFENRDPADYEAIGLFYAGFMFLGSSIGALVGFLGSGGREKFLTGGWIDTLTGVIVGATIGIGMGLISNAIITLKKKK
ncbi:hypothetical protein [Paenibacillus sp. J2TS4]|uniref:hypothetical protein n=1 Tax=Paenibacillus sp. J2TS4 TaxID=2807194 RepID=UPI001B20AE83|nr:hypothetical protein [Paenibacillus sp. J2TS4]GIP36583.1 hypothetical protein J2TS4_57930 [Paenibacillus sp. J2TS4]